MTIEFNVLGKPTRDNAVYLKVDSGQSNTRFLFDCGHGCVDELPMAELHSIDAAFFSHFHMDHVSGFDSLLRFNFSREESDSFVVIGPTDTCRTIHHKLQGFTWNLVADSNGVIEVREFGDRKQLRQVFRTSDQFVVPNAESSAAWQDQIVFQNQDCTVSMIELNHGCVSGGYLVRESAKSNIDTNKINELGLKPGPWLKSIKDGTDLDSTMDVLGNPVRLGDLRDQLLVESAGNSFAYLTDFRVSGDQRERLVDFIKDVDVLVCENSYTTEDYELAVKNYHMTTAEVASLALDADVGELVLFHLSSRYKAEVFPELMSEACSIFQNTRWPEGWFV